MIRWLARLIAGKDPRPTSEELAKSELLPERLDHYVAIAKADRAIREMRRLERLARSGGHS